MRIPIRLQGCLQELPILYRFSMPVALGGLVSAPMRWLCSVILVNTPQGYFYAGLYYASFRLRRLFQVLGDAISHCILPLMASPEGYKKTTIQRANFLAVSLGWIHESGFFRLTGTTRFLPREKSLFMCLGTLR